MNTDKKKKTLIKYSSSLLSRLNQRFAIFMALEVLVSFFLYVSGNYQMFLDSTQNLLLICCAMQSVMLFILCFTGLILSLVSFFKAKKSIYWIQFGFYLIGFILSPIFMILVRIITFLEGGI